MELLLLLGGGLLLGEIALGRWRWRRSAVQAMVLPETPAPSQQPRGRADRLTHGVRGELLGLLRQRSSQPSSTRGSLLAPEVIAEAKALPTRRRKIEAILPVGEHTGWGLKESKDFVDGLG